jgi:hypothetical protein
MRKTQTPTYPRGTHLLAPRARARPKQVARWIQSHVEADGGRATFIGFGPSAMRLLGKAQRLLPDDYQAELILPKGVTNRRDGEPTWREQRHEYRLVVTRGTTQTTPLPHPRMTGDDPGGVA